MKNRKMLPEHLFWQSFTFVILLVFNFSSSIFLHDYLLLRLSYIIFEKKASNSAIIAVCCYSNIPKHFSADYGA